MRYMCFVRADENQGSPPQALYDAMGPFIEASFKSGKRIDTGGLAPTADTLQVRLANGKVTVVDGPFSESKEVVGGYAIIEVNSREEAIDVANQFLDLHKEHWPEWKGGCEIRQIFGPND